MSKGKEKFDKVMHEWGQGELRSSSGELVKYPSENKRAIAIAYSEARKVNPNYGNSSLTPNDRKNVKKSISEEKKAQKDYTSRANKSRSKKVKSTFNHIKKEERTHEKEFEDLL